jgi:lipopolysaccharide/colanic/teichoic acid biosynthesis glycosyltransferase
VETDLPSFAAKLELSEVRTSTAARAARCMWPLVKRCLDIAVATLLLVAMSTVFLLIAIAIKLDTRGSVFYRVKRVGYRGRPLLMTKFRKMHGDAAGGPLTADRDPRLTKVGAVLTRSRLDELPQFWDVLRGRMSLIGPRPEDPGFVALHRRDYEQILDVRPGITGLAQIAYAEESRIVDADNPIDDYVTRIMPQKLILDKLYARRYSLGLDLRILAWTVITIPLRRPVSVDRCTGEMNVRRRPAGSPPPAPRLQDAGSSAAARAQRVVPAASSAQQGQPAGPPHGWDSR